jgi:hypothetical protein
MSSAAGTGLSEVGGTVAWDATAAVPADGRVVSGDRVVGLASAADGCIADGDAVCVGEQARTRTIEQATTDAPLRTDLPLSGFRLC